MSGVLEVTLTQSLCAEAHRLHLRLEAGLSLFNRECLVIFNMAFNVALDLILIYGSCRCTEVSPRPDVLAPVPLLQLLEFYLHLPGTLPF